MQALHRTIALIESKARALVLADQSVHRAQNAEDRYFALYCRAKATRELRNAMRGVKVRRLTVAGQRVVRCDRGFRVIPGEQTDGCNVAIEGVVL